MSSPPERSRSFRPGQQITRLPAWRPGVWVKLRSEAEGVPPDLAGKVRRVKSLTCSVTAPDQATAVWRVHFEDGRCVEVRLVLREATREEALFAQRRLS